MGIEEDKKLADNLMEKVLDLCDGQPPLVVVAVALQLLGEMLLGAGVSEENVKHYVVSGAKAFNKELHGVKK